MYFRIDLCKPIQGIAVRQFKLVVSIAAAGSVVLREETATDLRERERQRERERERDGQALRFPLLTQNKESPRREQRGGDDVGGPAARQNNRCCKLVSS